MARSWYAFIGGNDPTDIQNYYKVTVKHDCLCGDQICAVYAKENKDQEEPHPAPFSMNMQQYIRDALSTKLLQPEHPYNTKKYVYLKY